MHIANAMGTRCWACTRPATRVAAAVFRHPLLRGSLLTRPRAPVPRQTGRCVEMGNKIGTVWTWTAMVRALYSRPSVPNRRGCGGSAFSNGKDISPSRDRSGRAGIEIHPWLIAAGLGVPPVTRRVVFETPAQAEIVAAFEWFRTACFPALKSPNRKNLPFGELSCRPGVFVASCLRRFPYAHFVATQMSILVEIAGNCSRSSLSQQFVSTPWPLAAA